VCPTLSASHYQLSEPIAVDRCRYLTRICCTCWPSQDFAGGDYSRAERVLGIDVLADLAELYPMSSINGYPLSRFHPLDLSFHLFHYLMSMLLSAHVLSTRALHGTVLHTSQNSVPGCKAAAVSLHFSGKEGIPLHMTSKGTLIMSVQLQDRGFSRVTICFVSCPTIFSLD